MRGALRSLTCSIVLVVGSAAVAACSSGGSTPDGSTESAPTAPSIDRVPDGGALGTNLGGVNYWDGVVPFANLVDQAGDWIPQAEGAAWGEGMALTFDGHGWPTDLQPGQYASAVLAEVSYPAGTYTVR